MLIMFNSGFVHDGHVVMSRKASALHYLEFWFWVDIIAQLPYELILDGKFLFLQKSYICLLSARLYVHVHTSTQTIQGYH